jgi:NADH-quinone oxidoreductase subunit J
MFTLNYLFSTGLWIGSILLLSSKNPVHSVFYLVLVFLCAAAQLITLSMDFFGLVLLLVYVGALAIMFLFVVMLLDINVTEIVAHQRGHFPLASLYALVFLGLIMVCLNLPLNSERNLNMYIPQVENTTYNAYSFIDWVHLDQMDSVLVFLGVCIYTVYADLLLLVSLILLVAMVGAVVLTLQKRTNVPSNDVLLQHTRRFEQAVIVKEKQI